MQRPRRQVGFTLIEVLVALAIIAVAMAAAVRVAGLMTQSNGLLRDRSIALLAARAAWPNCACKRACQWPEPRRLQGRLLLRCEQRIAPATDPRLLSINLTVLDRSREAPPLARPGTYWCARCKAQPVQEQRCGPCSR